MIWSPAKVAFILSGLSGHVGSCLVKMWLRERGDGRGGGGSTMEAALQGVSVSISVEGMLTPWLPDAPPISTLHPIPPSLLVWGLTPPLRYLISPPSFRRQMGARVRLAVCLRALNVTPCKVERQYLLTFQVGSYCLLALREECCRARGRMFVTLCQNQLFLHSGQSPI